MTDIVNILNDPDSTSSLFPFLVITTILGAAFLTAACMVALKIWRALRTSLDSSRPAPLNLFARLREKLRRVFSAGTVASESPPIESEIDLLRKLVEKLQRENLTLREQYGKAVGRIDELEGVLAAVERDRDDSKKLIDIERLQRRKLEDRGAQLEAQVKDVIAEVEKIYQQNCQVSETAGREITKNSAGEKTSSSGMGQQTTEIQQLKEVIGACRQRMTEIEAGVEPGVDRSTSKNRT